MQAKEKVMLFILVLVALILLPLVFMILPAKEANTQKQRELDALVESGLQNSMAGSSPAGLEAQLDGLKAEADGMDSIPSRIKAYDIHYFAEDICNKTGAFIDGLQVGEYEQVETQAQEGEASLQEGNILYRCSVDMQLNGSFAQLMDTVDEFASYGYIVISRCNMNDIPTASPIECTLGLDIYAVIKPGEEGFTLPVIQEPEEEAGDGGEAYVEGI